MLAVEEGRPPGRLRAIRASSSRQESLARQRHFSDGSMSRWSFLLTLRADISRQGGELAAQRAGRHTVADTTTILARLAASKRRVFEMIADLDNRRGDQPVPPMTPGEQEACWRLLVRLYDLAEVGVREATDLLGSDDPATAALGAGLGREAELVRTLIQSDRLAWRALRDAVSPALATPAE